ncbi:MAG: hypothetical protein ABL857_03950 [Rickettsiales bacterium]
MSGYKQEVYAEPLQINPNTGYPLANDKEKSKPQAIAASAGTPSPQVSAITLGDNSLLNHPVIDDIRQR